MKVLTLDGLTTYDGKIKEYISEACNNSLWYGFQYDTTVSDPKVTRIGNLSLHKAINLPLQSKIKGCLVDGVTGKVNSYLNPTDWSSEILDGSAGQVMIELPKELYFKCETEGTIVRMKFSELPLGGFHKVSQMYVGAYEGTINRDTNQFSSVMSMEEKYRGGSNNSSLDGTYKSLLGRPATAFSRINGQIYARNRNASASSEWNLYTYLAHKLLYWMFILEYGTRNSQAPVTAELTSEGYKQGGLGAGVTNMVDWGGFNGYYPFVKCGHTNSIGNGSGEVAYDVINEDGTTRCTVMANRYRGVEQPFGHIDKWVSGLNIDIKADADGGTSKVYVCNNPEKFSDVDVVDYDYRGLAARDKGYISKIIAGEYGDILTTEVGGGSSTHFCDYYYTSIRLSRLRGVDFGGHAAYGSTAGFAYAGSSYSPASTNANLGSRLCFIPENE